MNHRGSEAHRFYEEQNLKQSTRSIPIGGDLLSDDLPGQAPQAPKKDNRLNISIGAFNDGARFTLGTIIIYKYL